MPLTESQAKNAKPRKQAYKLADAGGLFLLVQPNGARLWRLKYRYDARKSCSRSAHILTLGSLLRGTNERLPRRSSPKAVIR